MMTHFHRVISCYIEKSLHLIYFSVYFIYFRLYHINLLHSSIKLIKFLKLDKDHNNIVRNFHEIFNLYFRFNIIHNLLVHLLLNLVDIFLLFNLLKQVLLSVSPLIYVQILWAHENF